MSFRVTGIGASAGGLEAVSELLGALPAGTAMACVVVQHLDPRHDSLLPEILAKKATVPVTLVLDGEAVQPHHVYVIPPNTTLTVAAGRFHLTERPAFDHHLPVDALFRSLATEYADDAIGVVLSGGDSDGSLGLQAIKHAGGIVFAQRPDSARFPNMPRHAIETGCVDWILSPAEIGRELARLSGQPSLRGVAPQSPLTTLPDVSTDGDEALLKRIFRRLREAHGLDFIHYKRSTLRRRLQRRMTLRGIESLDEYATLIESDPVELASLHQDFLVRVTEFFRDPDSSEALRQHVFPALRDRRSSRQPIRIWVPGCATGEEVYSVVIELLEFMGDRLSSSEVQVFGSDVSEAALERARAGVYHSNITRDVSHERLQRFFEGVGDGYRIGKEIRDLCIFARQDVTRDPPFSRLDLVSCRNLLIYLDEVAQRRVFQALHFALHPNGMLLVGPAETVGQASELFEQMDKRFRIYRRRPGSGVGTTGRHGGPSHDAALERPADLPRALEADSLPREADRWLLARFAPASLLVDEALNIQQFRGRTGPFLEPAGGPPSLDLRRVVRPELLVELLPAIRQARETGFSVRREGLHPDGTSDVSIEVVPLAGHSRAQWLLILLDDGSHPPRERRSEALPDSTVPDSEKDRRLDQLQHEIAAMRDYLRAAMEEHGAIQEELKSAHEEMLSANEEYQSTNEELETAKEELESTNEELTTTIDELRSRNRDLGILNVETEHARLGSARALAYADAIIATVRSPLAVIDGEGRIKRVNAAFITDLDVRRERVEGVLIDDAVGNLGQIPGLRQKLHDVIRDGTPMEDWEVTLDLPAHGRRVVTLNARRIPGDQERGHLVLIAIDDVTERVTAAEDLLVNSRRKDDFLAMLAHELRHPLTPITHAIHLLRATEVDPATAASYEVIETQTRRLAKFVDELVDIVRVDRGLLEITRERLNLVEVAGQAAASVRPLVELRRHTLTCAFPDQPILVDGDPHRLNQVISNLLENAAKYTERGGDITLTLERHGDEAVLRVRDNGVGIASSDLQRIFEPFTQADHSLARIGGGLGLGLSVVRRVLGLLGGRIEARSAGLGTGSEFTVWLPTVRASDAPSWEAPPSTNESSPAAARARKVLIVDDREEVTKSLTRLLGAFGHEVAIAGNAASAITEAKAFQPDCAIVDIGLPGVSGYALAGLLREALPATRPLLIAYTGDGRAGVQDKCRAAGFDACLIKPGDPAVLKELLQTERQV
jgi:two-component system CheB/CheR fusion protein